MSIGPLRAWACSYTHPDGTRHGITLYATSPDMIDRSLARDLRIDGLLVWVFRA